MDKLEQAGYEEKRAEEMRGLVVKAMMEAGMREAEL